MMTGGEKKKTPPFKIENVSLWDKREKKCLEKRIGKKGEESVKMWSCLAPADWIAMISDPAQSLKSLIFAQL